MTTQEAIKYLDNLRKSVMTVNGQNGPQPVCGADHDIWREAIEVIRNDLDYRNTPVVANPSASQCA